MEQQTTGSEQDQPQNTAAGNEVPTEDIPPKPRVARIKEKILPGVRITLLISLIFYLAMLVVGCLGVHKCPVNDNIPLFLIATGAISLISKWISAIRDKILPHFKIHIVECPLYTAETVFLILGSYWVFKEYQPSYDERDKEHYCQKTLYLFAFVYLAVFYAILIALLLGFICFLGCMFFVKMTDRSNQDPEAQVRIQTSEEARDYGTASNVKHSTDAV